ncbi:hypothetical protein PAV_8c01410 [Paenibacillus alvei DSM 29]|nr:hypothetical protein PAV_8c01410 [Paenibacillus alvei DSM 29]
MYTGKGRVFGEYKMKRTCCQGFKRARLFLLYSNLFLRTWRLVHLNRNVGKYRSLETNLFNNQFLLIIIPNNVKSRYNFERVQARALKRLVELLKEEKDHLIQD